MVNPRSRRASPGPRDVVVALILAAIAALLFAYWIGTPALKVVSISAWRVVGAAVAGLLGWFFAAWASSRLAIALGVAAGIVVGAIVTIGSDPNVASGIANNVGLAIRFFWIEIVLFPLVALAGAWVRRRN